MKRPTLTLCLICLIHLFSFAQEPVFEWGLHYGGPWLTTFQETVVDMTTDSSGNIYSVGFFKSQVDFDPGPGTFNLDAKTGDSDLYIQKLDSNGDFVWARKLGTNLGRPWPLSFTNIDKEGNIYTTGLFFSETEYINGTDTILLTSAGHSDIYIHKLNADGDLIWAKRFGDGSGEFAYSIEGDTDGNIYVGGCFFDSTYFNNSVDSFYFESDGEMDALILKLDSNGEILWAKSHGGMWKQWDIVYDLEVDDQGNIYTYGLLDDSRYLDGGAWGHIQKLDFEGSLLWERSFDLGPLGDVTDIQLGPDGNLIAIGNMLGTTTFTFENDTVTLVGSYSRAETFVLKIDPRGDLIRALSFGDPGGVSSTDGLDIDDEGNIYIAGVFPDTVDIDPGIGVVNLVSNGSTDIFFLKLDSNGDLIWARSFGGIGMEYLGDIVVDDDGLLITGLFQETMDLDPGPDNYDVQSNGSEEMFMIRFNEIIVDAEEFSKAEQKDIFLYPNPSQNLIEVNLGEVYNTGEMSLVDVHGRSLKKVEFLNSSIVQMKIDDVLIGQYFLRINTGDQQIVIKLIKE